MSKAIDAANRMLKYAPLEGAKNSDAPTVEAQVIDLVVGLQESPGDADAIRTMVSAQRRALRDSAEHGPTDTTADAAHNLALRCAIGGIMLGTIDGVVKAVTGRAPETAAIPAAIVQDSAAQVDGLGDQGVSFRWQRTRMGLFSSTESITASQAASLVADNRAAEVQFMSPTLGIPEWTAPSGLDELKEMAAFVAGDFNHVANPGLARNLQALHAATPYAAYRTVQQQHLPITIGSLAPNNAEEIHLLAYLQGKAPVGGLTDAPLAATLKALQDAGFNAGPDQLATWRQLHASESPCDIKLNNQIMGRFTPGELRETNGVMQNLSAQREAYGALGKVYNDADRDALWPMAKGPREQAWLLGMVDQKPARHLPLYAEVLKTAGPDGDLKALSQDAAGLASCTLNDPQQVAAWTELRKMPDADSRARFTHLLATTKDVPLTVRASAVVAQGPAAQVDERMEAVERLLHSGTPATAVSMAEALAKADRLTTDAPLMVATAALPGKLEGALAQWQQAANAKDWMCLDSSQGGTLGDRLALVAVAKQLSTVPTEQHAAWEILADAKLDATTAQAAVNVARSVHPLESPAGFTLNPSDATCWTDVVNSQNHAHQGDTLTTRPMSLEGLERPSLQFQSFLMANATGQPCVEVSEDGKSWKKVAEFAVTTNWVSQDVDLSAWSGKTIQVRVREQEEPGTANAGLYVKGFNLVHGSTQRVPVALGEVNRSVALRQVVAAAGDDPKTALPLMYQLSSKVPHLDRTLAMWSNCQAHQKDGRFPVLSNALIAIFTRNDVNPFEMLEALGSGDVANSQECYNAAGAQVTAPAQKMALYHMVREAGLEKMPPALDGLLRTTSGWQSAGWVSTRAANNVLSQYTTVPGSLSTGPVQIPAGARLHFQSFVGVGETGAVEASTDGGKVWKTLKSVPDSQNWTDVEVPLGDYANKATRFRFSHENPQGGAGNRFGVQHARLETGAESTPLEDAARVAMAAKLLDGPPLEPLQHVAQALNSTEAALAVWPWLADASPADRDALVKLLTPRVAPDGPDRLAETLGSLRGEGSLEARFQQHLWAQDVAPAGPLPVYQFINQTKLDQAGVQMLKALATKPADWNGSGTWTLQNANPQGRCWVNQNPNSTMDLVGPTFHVDPQHPPTLTFQACQGTGQAAHVLEVSTDGQTWKPMDETFDPGVWQEHHVDLKPWAGQHIQMRFHRTGPAGQATNFWVGPMRVDGTPFESTVQGQRLDDIMRIAQESAVPGESLRQLNSAADLEGLRKLLVSAPGREDRSDLLKLVAHQADLPTLHDLWSKVSGLDPEARHQELVTLQRLTQNLGGLKPAQQVWSLLLPLHGSDEQSDTEAAITMLAKEPNLDEALKAWSVLRVAGDGTSTERADWYVTARHLAAASGLQQTMDNNLSVYQELRGSGLPVPAAQVLRHIMDQPTPRPPKPIEAVLAAAGTPGADDARRLINLETIQGLTKQTNLVQAMQLWPALADVPPGPELEAKRTALGNLCASVGPEKALTTWKTLESTVRPVQPVQARVAATDPNEPQRLAHIQTLLDAGFHFKGPSPYPTAQDVCIGLGKGDAAVLSFPGGSVEHRVPTYADFDAEGMVQLAKVRARGNRLLQGNHPPPAGSVELHQAQSIAGEYSDNTLVGYLRGITDTPDAASAEDAKRSLREQVGILDRGLGELESQARREALDEMKVQTQFLADALGGGGKSSPFDLKQS